MVRTQHIGEQRIDGPSNKNLARVAKNDFALRVEQHDPPVRPDNQERIGRGLDQTLKTLFGLLSPGDVEGNTSNGNRRLAGVELEPSVGSDPARGAVTQPYAEFLFEVRARAQGVL